MSNSVITGVDIGHHSLKAIVIKPVKGTLILSNFRELVIEDDIFTDNHLLNYQKIVNKLKELRKVLPLFSRKVALSLPDNSVISKVLQVEKDLSQLEQEYAIFEAFSHQSPFDIEELYLDYCCLPFTHSAALTQSVQVYATKKEVVDNRIDVCRKAGLNPVLLDVHAHGLVRLWQQVARQQNRYHWLLLDVGWSHSSMVMDNKDHLPWCKELPLGTEMLHNATDTAQTSHHEATLHFIHILLERVQRQLQLLDVEQKHQLQGVWLTGGGAHTPQLAEKLATTLNLECERFDPLTLFTHSKSVQLSDSGYSYAVAVGLALQGFDWMAQEHAA